MAHTITDPKTIQRKSRKHQVRHIWANQYEVTSGASGSKYTVTLHTDGKGGTCSCKWGQYRPRSGQFKSGCSHVIAVVDYIEEQRTVSAWTDEEQARRQHRPVHHIGDGVVLTTRKAGS